MADGGQSKTEKATPKKRRDQRKEGNVALSKDVVSIIFVFGAFYSLKLLFPGIAQSTSSFTVGVLEMLSNPAHVTLGSLNVLGMDFIMTAVGCLAPILFICMALGIVGTGIQTRFLFSKKAVMPKFSRLNPIQGIKRLFSLKNLVELLKGLIKITVMIVVLYMIFKKDIVSIVRTMDMDVRVSAAYILSLIIEMVLKLSLVFLVIAFFDVLYQRWEYERNIKMTKEEVKEEYKQLEGNPEIKSKIKGLQRQRAQSRMMQAVPEADVIIKNPTHYAVALKYDMDSAGAPVLVAKGQDYLALRIIDVGETNNVVVIENRQLARAIYATTDLNQEIPQEYYGAVAEVLVYVYRLNKKDGVV